jgi:hypothetical protein
MRLALVCIVSLAVASTIGLAILSTIAPHIDTATLKDFLDAPRLTRSTIGKILPMGDPIDDPKPNNAKH